MLRVVEELCARGLVTVGAAQTLGDVTQFVVGLSAGFSAWAPKRLLNATRSWSSSEP
ncbi:hypothetical protein Save01_05778 [Streptomyces avermitilis]